MLRRVRLLTCSPPEAELAKVDPSVSVLCDVHNTLVNTIFRKYGSDFVKDKYLPMLSENKVSTAPQEWNESHPQNGSLTPVKRFCSSGVSACLRLGLARTRSRCRRRPRRVRTARTTP